MRTGAGQEWGWAHVERNGIRCRADGEAAAESTGTDLSCMSSADGTMLMVSFSYPGDAYRMRRR